MKGHGENKNAVSAQGEHRMHEGENFKRRENLLITRVHKKGTKAKKEHLGSRKTKGAASAGGESKMCEGVKKM